MKLASFGALVHGSTGHFFYNFLDSKIPGTAAITVAKKIFIDQVSPSVTQSAWLDIVFILWHTRSKAHSLLVLVGERHWKQFCVRLCKVSKPMASAMCSLVPMFHRRVIQCQGQPYLHSPRGVASVSHVAVSEPVIN